MNILNLMNISYMNPYVAGLSGGAVAENAYGVSWDESQSTGGYARTEDTLGQAVSTSLSDALLPIHANMKRCVINDAGVVQYYLDASNSALKADGVTASVLTGADGQVMVEIPAFYYKYSKVSTTHTWEIADGTKVGYELHPAFIKNGVEVDHRYIGAYEGVTWDNSASAYIDGVSFSGDTGADKLSSVTGKAPWTGETRAEFRSYGSNRGSGWRQLDYDLFHAVQLLYITEYASWYSQSMIGKGRTELSGGTWTKDSYIGVTGKSNSDGNGTNSVAGNSNNAYMTYRGIENFYGNLNKFVDGVNVQAGGNILITNDDSDWADNTATGYIGSVADTANYTGYVCSLVNSSRGIFALTCHTIQGCTGSSSTYLTNSFTFAHNWCVVVIGGGATYVGNAGMAFMDNGGASSIARAYLGSRLAF